MEEITIDRKGAAAIEVLPGRAVKSRLVWQAPGLDVYVRGSISDIFEIAGNAAINEAICRNIPAISVRRVGK